MLQNNHSLARPCPSCGVPLRVHSGRLNQRMQCPKCLDTIVLDAATTPVPPAKKGAQKIDPAQPSSTQPARDLTQPYAELLLEHAELAERYADAVADYDRLVTLHAELTMRLHQLAE